MPNPVVVAYNPQWPQWFEQIKAHVWPQLSDFALAIEHVGSTSVEGLAAKPVIDIDVVIAHSSQLPLAILRLTGLGYVHKGNQGIPDREAFKAPVGWTAHHLYVCLEGSLGLHNHLLLRQYLRANPAARQAYSDLKLALAAQHQDMDEYVRGKTELILQMLAEAGLTAEQLETIRRQNGE